jgi:predicted glycosyltransferase involved in capsule biosynthesis
MLLTIITQGRNDNYMGNFMARLARTINKHASNIDILDIHDEVELLCTDWGSKSALYNALKLTEMAKRIIKYCIVPAEIAAKYDKDAGFSVVHSINTAVRRAQGEYVCILDSDVYVPLETMARLMYLLRQKPDNFYWASKYHIPQVIANTEISQQEMDEQIELRWWSYLHEKVNQSKFSGYGVALTVKREDWQAVHGLDENLIYWGWNDVDITHRLGLLGRRFYDLETMGMKFYHLEHYANNRRQMHQQVDNRKYNEHWVYADKAVVNDDDWGLANEPIIMR